MTVLIIIALAAPAAITLIISLLVVPGTTTGAPRLNTHFTSRALRLKLWEWNISWLGLALALATAFMITEGLKDLAGKPRPHALAVCDPDLSAASISRWRVGGFGQAFDSTGATPILVEAGICRNQNAADLRDAFASWPSGHSSFSCAGLVYLSLFLCAKASVGWPWARGLGESRNAKQHYTGEEARADSETFTESTSETPNTKLGVDAVSSRSEHTDMRLSSAAPPIWLLILCILLPVCTAAFVCVSRWFDFHHHGLDIFSGAVIGTFTAWFSFRWYHMPVRRGRGWAWGARGAKRAFWRGVGAEGWGEAQCKTRTDMEAGQFEMLPRRGEESNVDAAK